MKIQRVLFFVLVLAAIASAGFWDSITGGAAKGAKKRPSGSRKGRPKKVVNSEADPFVPGTEGPKASDIDLDSKRAELLEKARRYRQKSGGPSDGEVLSAQDVQEVLSDRSIPDSDAIPESYN